MIPAGHRWQMAHTSFLVLKNVIGIGLPDCTIADTTQYSDLLAPTTGSSAPQRQLSPQLPKLGCTQRGYHALHSGGGFVVCVHSAELNGAAKNPPDLTALALVSLLNQLIRS